VPPIAFLVEKNGSKMRARVVPSIPHPLSSTVRQAYWPAPSVPHVDFIRGGREGQDQSRSAGRTGGCRAGDGSARAGSSAVSMVQRSSARRPTCGAHAPPPGDTVISGRSSRILQHVACGFFPRDRLMNVFTTLPVDERDRDDKTIASRRAGRLLHAAGIAV